MTKTPADCAGVFIWPLFSKFFLLITAGKKHGVLPVYFGINATFVVTVICHHEFWNLQPQRDPLP